MGSEPSGHGPWSAKQIADALDDMGVEPDEFGDTCDQCFVREVGRGDVAYAEHLLARKLNLPPRPTGLLALIDEYRKEPHDS